MKNTFNQKTIFLNSVLILIFTFNVLFSLNSFAQAPNKISYQTVVRDASNMLIANTSIGIRLSIIQGTLNGTIVYQETHQKTTNINGLVSLEIGSGIVLIGNMPQINWGNGPYFIQTEIDPTGGTTYTISGSSEIMSVPYALYSANSSINANNGLTNNAGTVQLGGNLIQNSIINGGATSATTGNDMTVENIKKMTTSFWDVEQKLGLKRFLHTTCTPNAGNGNLLYGNFFFGYGAGNSFDNSSTGYANTVFGRNAGYLLNGSNSNASSNALFGYGAMENTTFAVRNTIIGVAAGGNMGNGSSSAPITGNTLIGHHAGRQINSNYNIAIGASALENQTAAVNDIIGIGQYALKDNAGNYNVGIGYNTMSTNTIGVKNTALGWGSGQSAAPASASFTQNTLIGYKAGGGQTAGGTFNGGYNTIVGAQAGEKITCGNSNTFIGYNAGALVTTADQNVFIGNNAGTSVTGANNIIIGRALSLQNASNAYELNLGGAIFGENIYTGQPRIGIGAWPSDKACLDMSSQITGVILPQGTTAQEPTNPGNIQGTVRYNTSLNNTTVFNSNSNSFVPIGKIKNVTTSTSGASLDAKTMLVVLDATNNSITQTLPAILMAYKDWEFTFITSNNATNAISFSLPSNSYVNGKLLNTYTATRGESLHVNCDGINYFITTSNPREEFVVYNNSSLNLNGEANSIFDQGASGTIVLPTVVTGTTINLTNFSGTNLNLNSSIKTGTNTTSNVLPDGVSWKIMYVNSVFGWIKVTN
jgi:hypothetical protein